MGNIGFKKAKCKDCSKCIRTCPVKAIRNRNDHAQYLASDCILCGQCLEACPQDAIVVLSDIDKVKKYIDDGDQVVLSVSPAYLGAIDETEPGQFIEALYQLGFYKIRETAEAAIYVTNEYDRLLHEEQMDNIITSACPVINTMVENYYPDLIKYMAPVVPPIIAHGRMLREDYGDDVRIVSLTPCLAEAIDCTKDPRTKGAIDAVISFKEVLAWMEELGIDVTKCNTYHHKRMINPMVNGAYATSGGVIKSLRAKSGEDDNYKRISVHGMHNCKDVLECIRRGELTHCLVELRSCISGCVSGPVSGKKPSERFKSQMLVQERIMKTFPEYEEKPNLKLEKTFITSRKVEELPSEEAIREILAKFGKETPDKELNCGGCGFDTCREKAIAVLQNRSSIDTCYNYMFELVRSFTDIFMSVTPEMIIVADRELKIRVFNQAAAKAFKISTEEALQKYLYEIIDVEDFQDVFETKEDIHNKKVAYKSYDLMTIQTIIYMKNQDVVIGFFADVTEQEKKKQARLSSKLQSVKIAQEIIDKQMRVAQEIAGLLGETTAETKMAVSKLRDSIMSDGDDM